MKFALLIILLSFLGNCTHSSNTKSDNSRDTATALTGSHESVFPHPHKHAQNCGHKTETVGFDTYYIHDGHKHMVHAGHVDKK